MASLGFMLVYCHWLITFNGKDKSAKEFLIIFVIKLYVRP